MGAPTAAAARGHRCRRCARRPSVHGGASGRRVRPRAGCPRAARGGSSRRRRRGRAAARGTARGSGASRRLRARSRGRSIAQRKAASVLPEPVGRQQERVLPLSDRRPALRLGVGGRLERGLEPGPRVGGEGPRLTAPRYPLPPTRDGVRGCPAHPATLPPRAPGPRRCGPRGRPVRTGGRVRPGRRSPRAAGPGGPVRGAVVARGQTVGEVVVFDGNVTVDGVVDGDVIVMHGNVTVAGTGPRRRVVFDGDRAPAPHGPGRRARARRRRGHRGGRRAGRRRGHRRSALHPVGTRRVPRGAPRLGRRSPTSVLLAPASSLIVAPRGAERVAQAARDRAARLGRVGGSRSGSGSRCSRASPPRPSSGLPFGLALLLGLGLFWLVGEAWTAWTVGRLLVREPAVEGGRAVRRMGDRRRDRARARS